MPEIEDTKAEFYNAGFKAGQEHSKPSPETCERLDAIEAQLRSHPFKSWENFKSWIANNILTILAIIVTGVVSWYTMQERITIIEMKLDTIQNNHLVHLQESIDKNSERNDAQDKQIQELAVQVAKMTTLVEKYFK